MSVKFFDTIQSGYTFKGKAIDFGAAMLNGEAETGALVRIPLRTLNRHGLIAGATGTGKTKTLQILAEQLAEQGVPSLVMDMKGDLSGIATAGKVHPKILERHQKIGFPWIEAGQHVEFLTLSEEKGARLRATVSEFGPVLFSRILGLNETQTSIMALVFKYCDDKEMPLLDLKDVRKVLQYIMGEGKEEIKAEYGTVSSMSVGSISRKMVELEQQGAERFFGELSFDVQDLCRQDDTGRGIVSVLRLTDIQDRPKLFSTFMLQLLAEIYATFPEEGDAEKPKLCIFIDEAHLVFSEASKALLNQLETVIKLIRSKGIGIFFITQNPVDVPDSVLGQLGLKVQHALRAFTAKDRKAIKLAAQNYPESEFYDVEELLTSLGIGEALVTALNEKGIPTPLAHTLLRAPMSRMDTLSDAEVEAILSKSSLIAKYNEEIDRESAYEILTEKIKAEESAPKPTKAAPKKRGRPKKEKSTIEQVLNNPTTRQIGRTVARELTRGLLGVLGIPTSRRRRRGGWF